MRFGIRDLVYIGIFGALWGAVEIGLGSVLHVMNVPLTGMVMAAVGTAVALVGRVFVPRPGSVLFIGLVTALVKMLSLGGTVLNPMVGIVSESVLAELVLTVGRLGRPTFMAAGALAALWPFFQPFVLQGILAGQGILRVYSATASAASRLLGVDPSAVTMVLTTLVAIHLAVGCLAGALAWDAGRVVQARVRPSDPSSGSE